MCGGGREKEREGEPGLVCKNNKNKNFKLKKTRVSHGHGVSHSSRDLTTEGL